MKRTNQWHDQKGGMSFYYVLLVVVLTLGILFTFKYFHDRTNDITVHLPTVEVR
jgi:hypothetical protein